MPIAKGQRGRPGILAIPGDRLLRGHPLRSKPAARNASLTGISRDNTGAALGGCTVKLFRTWDDVMIASAVSDGSGSYTLFPASSGPYYLVEYKAGAPDVAGTSRNDLVAV